MSDFMCKKTPPKTPNPRASRSQIDSKPIISSKKDPTDEVTASLPLLVDKGKN